MNSATFTFKASDGKEIFSRKWLPEQTENLKAIVQISHGMAEHSERYKRFAEALTASNIGVYANDHRGHGQTAGKIENLGYFADSNGWLRVVEDMKNLTSIIKENHPAIPVFLFGHSMGSLLSREYVFSFSHKINGLILSATAGDPRFLGNLGIIISKLESLLRGKKTKSTLLDKLSFGKFNTAFKPNRTAFDWLSRDNAEVDKYIEDPYCGTVFTAGFFNDMLKGIKSINKFSNIQKVSKDLPVYLFAGAKDPVGDNTKGVMQVINTYKKAGIRDLSFKFYEDARHEMLNEINRVEVFADVINWIELHTGYDR
ncbi:MAG: alpha/beta hydrolase [Bacteroidota bacterium]